MNEHEYAMLAAINAARAARGIMRSWPMNGWATQPGGTRPTWPAIRAYCTPAATGRPSTSASARRATHCLEAG